MSSTLFRLLQESVLRYPSLAALRESEGEGRTRIAAFAELYTWVTELGTGLIDLGLEATHKVVLIGEPGSRWLAASLAVLGCRAVRVTCGADLSDEALQDLLFRSQAGIVFVADRRIADRVLALRRKLKSQLRGLDRVIVLGDAAVGGRFSLWRLFALPLFTWEEVLGRGRTRLHEGDHRFDLTAAGIEPQDTASCHYPVDGWGADHEIVLTHEAVLNGVAAVQKQLASRPPGARWLAALPVGHPGELFIQSLSLRTGNTLVYSRPEIGRILRSLRQEQPECLVATPQTLHALHRSIMAGSRIRTLFYLSEAWQILRRQLRSQFPVGRSLWKIGRGLIYLIPLMALTPLKVVSYSQVAHVRKAFLGGKLRTVISAAPNLLPQSRRLFGGLGLQVLETDPLLEPRTDGSSFLRMASRTVPLTEPEPTPSRLVEEKLAASPWIQEAVLVNGNGQGEPRLLVFPRLRALRGWAADQGIECEGDPELVGLPQVRHMLEREVERRAGCAYPLEIHSSGREIRRIRLEELIGLGE